MTVEEIICPHCDKERKVNMRDEQKIVNIKAELPYLNDNESWTKFNCPSCKKEIKVIYKRSRY